jgi:hypothetical protein
MFSFTFKLYFQQIFALLLFGESLPWNHSPTQPTKEPTAKNLYKTLLQPTLLTRNLFRFQKKINIFIIP